MAQNSTKSSWAGLAILVIAGVHTLFGVLGGLRVLPDPQMQRLVGDRVPLLELKPALFASEPSLAAMTMFWFLFFGLALFPLGALVRHFEKELVRIPRFVGYQLVGLGFAGVLFLPASGFWLVFIPAWQILSRRRPRVGQAVGAR